MALDTARASTPPPPLPPDVTTTATPTWLDKYKERARVACRQASIILLELLQDLFDLAVQFCGSFMAAVLAHPDVQEAAAQIMVKGMNGFVTQDDLNETMKIMSDTMARGQEDFARSAGADFPKLAGKFFEGMMSRKDKNKEKEAKEAKEAKDKEPKKDTPKIKFQASEEEQPDGPIRKDSSDSITFASLFQGGSNHQQQAKKETENEDENVTNLSTRSSGSVGSVGGSPKSVESVKTSPTQQSQSDKDAKNSPNAAEPAKDSNQDDGDRARSVSPMMRPLAKWVSNSPFRPRPPAPSTSSNTPPSQTVPPSSETSTPAAAAAASTSAENNNANNESSNSHSGSTPTVTESSKQPSPETSTSKPPPKQHHEPLGGLFRSLSPRTSQQQQLPHPPPPQTTENSDNNNTGGDNNNNNPILIPTLSLSHAQDDTTLRQELQHHNP